MEREGRIFTFQNQFKISCETRVNKIKISTVEDIMYSAARNGKDGREGNDDPWRILHEAEKKMQENQDREENETKRKRFKLTSKEEDRRNSDNSGNKSTV